MELLGVFRVCLMCKAAIAIHPTLKIVQKKLDPKFFPGGGSRHPPCQCSVSVKFLYDAS